MVYPQDIPYFTGDTTPTVAAFREYILDVFQRAGLEPDRTVVLAHSLGGSGWLRVLQEREDLRQCLSWIIATPRDNKTGIDRINDFFPTPDLSELTDEQRGRITVIGSDNDSEIKEAPHVLGAHLAVPSITIPGAGHFMPRALHNDPTIMDLGKDWTRVRAQLGRLNFPY